MSYTNPTKSAEARYVAAQDRRDCCQGCACSDKRGDGDSAYLFCTHIGRRVARFSTCNAWSPVKLFERIAA